MERFERLTGVAAPLLIDDLDTDQIISVPNMLASLDPDFGASLFAHWRFGGDGAARDGFILNRPPFDRAQILLGGSNFGCGSSREHAVWALLGFGIRCVVAVSFGEIFSDNCLRQGLLPATLPREQIAVLARRVLQSSGVELVTVDLTAKTIAIGDAVTFAFTISDGQRHRLLNGLDEVEETLRHRGAIEAWEAADRRSRPWIHVSLNAAADDRGGD